jgi:hypothetical protein
LGGGFCESEEVMILAGPNDCRGLFQREPGRRVNINGVLAYSIRWGLKLSVLWGRRVVKVVDGAEHV